MAHGIFVDDNIKNLIAEVYIQNRKWPAHKIRTGVITRLHTDDRFQNYIDDPDWPRLSRIQKELHNLKEGDEKRSAESKALDKPWSVLNIAKHPIPPKILPVVLEAWGRELLRDDPLTVREALWVARLYYVLKDHQEVTSVLHDLETLTPSDDISVLTWSAKCYATDEIIYDIVGKQPDKPEDMWGDWFHDATLCVMKTGERGELMEKTSQEFRNRPHLVPKITEEEVQKRTYRGGTK